MKTLSVSLLIAAILMTIHHEAWAFRNVKTNEVAPNFKLNDLDGKQHELSDWRGNIAVLIFIKASQQTSVNALRDVCSVAQRLRGSAADKPRETDIRVLAIASNSFADERAELEKLLLNRSSLLTILLDKEKEVYGQYGVIVIPSTAIIGKDGIMRYVYPSYDYGYERHIEGYLKVLLGKLRPDELDGFVSPKAEVKNEPSEQAKRHYELGRLLLKRNLPDMAAKELRKALELDDTLSEARLELGYLLLDQKRADEAIREFEKMIGQGASVSQAKVGIAIAHSEKGDVENAEKMLTEAIALNPNPVRAHYELGKIYEEKGELRKAMLHYKAALEKLLKQQNNGAP